MSKNPNSPISIANAKREIEQWVKEFSELKTDAEREEFRLRLRQAFLQRDETTLTTGLLALQETAHEFRRRVERQSQPRKSIAVYEVSPESEDDKTLLRSVLKCMQIPYKETV